MKLNGRWFPQIVDRDSGNLFPIYPPFPCSDTFSFHILFVFYAISNIFRKKYFPGWGGGGGAKQIVVLASEPVGWRSQATELPCFTGIKQINFRPILLNIISHDDINLNFYINLPNRNIIYEFYIVCQGSCDYSVCCHRSSIVTLTTLLLRRSHSLSLSRNTSKVCNGCFSS